MTTKQQCGIPPGNRPSDLGPLHLGPLHLAALHGEKSSVKVHLKQGHNVNQPAPNTGVTPVMLACLSGSFSVLKLLIKQQARLDTKDRYGHEAGAYAKAHIEKGLFKSFLSLRQDLDSDIVRDRRKILSRVLKSTANLTLHANTDLPATDYCWLKHKGELMLLAPQVRLSIPAFWKNKTTACIIGKGNLFPEMFAVSGYSNTSSRQLCEQILDNERFTQLVMKFCQLIKFRLPAKLNDNGAKKAEPEHEGRWFAGHCEKKLAIYWLLKCVAHTSGDSSTADLPTLDQITALKKRTLPSSLRSATILLDRRPCFGGQGKCAEFLYQVREISGVDIWFEAKPSVAALELKKIGQDRCWVKENSEDNDANNGDNYCDDDDEDSDENNDNYDEAQSKQVKGVMEGENEGEVCDRMEEAGNGNKAVENNSFAPPQPGVRERDQARTEEQDGASTQMMLSLWERGKGSLTSEAGKHGPMPTTNRPKRARRCSIDSSGGDIPLSKQPRTLSNNTIGASACLIPDTGLEKPINPDPVGEFSTPGLNRGNDFYHSFEGRVGQLLQPNNIYIPAATTTHHAQNASANSYVSSYSETQQERARGRRRPGRPVRKATTNGPGREQVATTPRNRAKSPSPPLRASVGVSEHSDVIVRETGPGENVFNPPKIDKRLIATNLEYRPAMQTRAMQRSYYFGSRDQTPVNQVARIPPLPHKGQATLDLSQFKSNMVPARGVRATLSSIEERISAKSLGTKY